MNSILPNNLCKQICCITMSLLILLGTSSCRYYYVVSEEADVIPSLADPEGLNRYFIIHEDAVVKHLKISSFDNKILKGELEELPYYRNNYLYTNPDATESTKYKSSNREVIQEVHVYVKNNSDRNYLDSPNFEISFDEIEKLEIFEHDKETSTLVNIGTFIAGSGGAFVLIIIIAILLKSSCPFLYVNDGLDKSLAGELYGGAIFKNLERDDYLKLEALKNDNGFYHLQISNELKEKQYTDQFELLAADHLPGEKLYIDNHGNISIHKNAKSPDKAQSINDIDLMALIADEDEVAFQFNEDLGEEEAVILSFDEYDSKGVNLMLNCKNSYWLDYAFGAFTEKFGNFYEKWANKQDDEDPEYFKQWMKDQRIVLDISVRTEGEWQLVESIETFGPLMERDVMVSIPDNYLTEDKLDIKISSGFMFWELDHASISSSQENRIETKVLSCATLVDNGIDVDPAILHQNDDHFLSQEITGDRANVSFVAEAIPEGLERTLFAHSSGYYKHVRDYEGTPDFNELRKFRQKGYFHKFSQELYRTILEDELMITANE